MIYARPPTMAEEKAILIKRLRKAYKLAMKHGWEGVINDILNISMKKNIYKQIILK